MPEPNQNLKPLLLKTLAGEATSRPPFWFMRQAGRVLPSYMAIKEKYSFWQMMQTPEIAAQVTLLPVEDLGVDAAILFSDILVIPYAMGMGLDFTDNGPHFDTPLSLFADPMSRLHPDSEKLQYIYKAIDQVIITKPSDIPLIGFCGAPLTVLLYMLQGLSRKAEFPDAVKYIYENKNTTRKLVEAITELSIVYIREQIKHGVQVFQLFESHAGLIPLELYRELFMPSVLKISKAVKEQNVPFIFFPKGFGVGIRELTPEHCDYVSIDWHTPIEIARELVHPAIGLQGNLDPRALYGNKEQIEKTLEAYLDFGRNNQNWIFNLGHGFMPGISFENARFMADWLKNANWQR
ncbi:MAG: uroporphyrinogen decarboxylase [Bacteroidota bacterium]|nr:MAG: uroporphyrinogen decarboxylase [Bacteroidota bacterium]